jgi:hypothetical protein
VVFKLGIGNAHLLKAEFVTPGFDVVGKRS